MTRLDHSELEMKPYISYPEYPVAIIDHIEKTEEQSDSISISLLEPLVNTRSDMEAMRGFSGAVPTAI